MSVQAQPHPKVTLALLLIAACLLFMIAMGSYDLWAPDEPRFGEVAREMMVTGDYLAPHVNGLPYYEKPPLLFWLMAIVSWPAGEISEFTARFPSAASALITLICTYLLAARLFTPRVGLWAAIILATGARFWWQARTAQIDMVLTACLSAALLFFLYWHETRRVKWLILFYVGIAAGVYAKGPPALLFPLLMLLAFYWKRPVDRKATHWIVGMLVVVALVLAWLIPARMAVGPETMVATDTGVEQLQGGVAANLFRQTIGRMFLGVSKAQWPWYYLETLPVDLLPWSLFLPWTAVWVWTRRKDNDSMRFLWCYTAPALIFFSISVGKRAIYILPLFPVLAIFLALSILDLVAAERSRYRRVVAAIWGTVLVVAAAAPLAMRASEYVEIYTPSLWIFSAAAFCCGLAALVAMGPLHRYVHVVFAATFAVTATTAAVVAFPVINQVKSARYICEPVRVLADKGVEFDLYSLGFSREEYIFYSRHFHTPVMTSLLPIPIPEGMDVMEMAKQQKKLKKEIIEAAGEVPVASLESPTPAELDALRAAMHGAVETAEADAQLAGSFEDALRAEIEAFMTQFDTGGPAFTFVQQGDWRWLVALYPDLLNHEILTSRVVGSRDVFLLANAPAARAWQSTP